MTDYKELKELYEQLQINFAHYQSFIQKQNPLLAEKANLSLNAFVSGYVLGVRNTCRQVVNKEIDKGLEQIKQGQTIEGSTAYNKIKNFKAE